MMTKEDEVCVSEVTPATHPKTDAADTEAERATSSGDEAASATDAVKEIEALKERIKKLAVVAKPAVKEQRADKKKNKQQQQKAEKKVDPDAWTSEPHTGFNVLRKNDCAVTIEITNAYLTNLLRQHMNHSNMYASRPRIEAASLFPILPTIDSTGQPKEQVDPILKDLRGFLDKEFEENTLQLNGMLADGKVSFDYLSYIYKKDSIAIFKPFCRAVTQGGEIAKVSVVRTLFCHYIHIELRVIECDGESFVKTTQSFYITHFPGFKRIRDLDVVPLEIEKRGVDGTFETLVTEGLTETLQQLTERGKRYTKLALGANYQFCRGTLTRASHWNSVQYRATGRCMIDHATFAHINPNYAMGGARKKRTSNSPYDYDDGEDEEDDVGDWGTAPMSEAVASSAAAPATSLGPNKQKRYICCSSKVYGFSFVCKKWGEIQVDQVEDIVFDDRAFSNLVLDPKKKRLIRCLVEHGSGRTNDFIAGKGNGSIFLFHGPAGVGKTLTSEAIAELLRRPLYSVSVGELGTTPIDLERNLSQILEVASVWKAVILIDEVDIFLEARSEQDIARNALVAIFLRLLEYHSGVLMLTTNRVQNFDPAVFSRINCALKYHDLDTAARRQIWRSMLSNRCATPAEEEEAVRGIDLDTLASRTLNGRQIQAVVKLARTVCLGEKRDQRKGDGVTHTEEEEKELDAGHMEMRHIEEVLEIFQQFDSDLKSTNK